MVGHGDSDILILHILGLRICRRYEVYLVHRVSRCRRQFCHTHVGELLNRIDELLHLCLGVGVRLQVVVHQVVDRLRDKVSDQCICLCLRVVVGDGCGNRLTDGCVHLGGRRVCRQCRVDGCTDLGIRLSFGVVVREVDGGLAYLLEIIDSTTAFVSG